MLNICYITYYVKHILYIYIQYIYRIGLMIKFDIERNNIQKIIKQHINTDL